VSPTPGGPDQRGELELELRLLPGVVNVGSTAEGVTVVALDPTPSLVEAATRTARLHSVEVPVSVVALSSPDRRPALGGRVALLGVAFDAATGTVQVELAHHDRRGTGQATSGPVVGAAEATLAALSDLGADVPFYLQAAGPAGSPVTTGPEPTVLVVLCSRGHDALGERIGVARGSSQEEAAARATLAALNRFLCAGQGARTSSPL